MLKIDNYLLAHQKKAAVRRTRRATKELIDQHKIEIKNVTSEEIFCEFNGSEMQVKYHEDSREVTTVSCFSCEKFCEHQEVLLLFLSKLSYLEASSADHQKRKRSESPEGSMSKRQKVSDENDANEDNINLPKIKIAKKKKTINLSEKEVQQIEEILSVLSMEKLIKNFGRNNYKQFYTHCTNIMTENKKLIELANKLTVEQADTDLWHELRIGRVTASRLHETTRCTVKNGSLIDKYLGKRGGWSFFMQRGTVLEEHVFNEVKNQYPTLQRCGLIMNQEKHPFFAASPDGLHEDFVLEIKCPGTPNTFQQYTNLEKLNKKYFAQIQLQMYITGKTKALLAVASLDFETTRNITTLWIPFDDEYVKEMIEYASEFYEHAIFPALKRKFLY